MKKLVILMLFGFFVNFIPNHAQATLIDMSNSSGHIIYDDASKNYWIWDLSLFSNKTYATQLSTIDSLNAQGNEYFGLSGWHMATIGEMESLWTYEPSDFIGIFNPTYTNSTTIIYAGRFDEIYPFYIPSHRFANIQVINGNPEKWGLYNYGKSDDDLSQNYGAWVVTSNLVPEPSTISLLFLGTLFLVNRKRKAILK